MGNVSDIFDSLDRINHRIMYVHELINLLAQQTPMMPVLGYDEDKGTPVYLNGIRVDTSDHRPVFILYFSETPKSNPDLYKDISHDERVALKKQEAFDMELESQRKAQVPSRD